WRDLHRRGSRHSPLLPRTSWQVAQGDTVADEADGASVGAMEPGTEPPVALDHLAVGKAEAVAPSHAEDDVGGADAVEESHGGAGAGAVVRRLEEVRREVGAGFDQRALSLLLHVAG